ncbi:MAG: hypothetical protein QMD71_04495 [bacterium]|nr:hypothetical protein [bacterium]
MGKSLKGGKGEKVMRKKLKYEKPLITKYDDQKDAFANSYYYNYNNYKLDYMACKISPPGCPPEAE